MRALILWLAIIIAVFLVWNRFQPDPIERITYATFLERVDSGSVRRVIIQGNELVGITKPEASGGQHDFRTTIPPNDPRTFDRLRALGVSVEMEPANDPPLRTALISWAPIIFLIGVWVWVMGRIRKRATNVLGNQPPQP